MKQDTSGDRARNLTCLLASTATLLSVFTAGCGVPAIDAMKVKSIELPGDAKFCVRQARMLPLAALMDDGSRRTIDPKAARATRFDPGVLEWTSSLGKVRVVKTGILHPDYAEFVPPENEADSLDEDVHLTVSMKGNPFMKSTLDLKADFSCPVVADFSGVAGASGSSGNNGSGNGGAGGPGTPGEPGANASPVEVFLSPYETEKHGTLIQVKLTGAQAGSSFLLAPDGKISLAARGGDGGRGGKGGDGSPGESRSGGCGDGGPGGPGGTGGPGAAGGSGGPVIVHVDDGHPDWSQLLDIDNGPGQGGQGGEGGPGGRGGSAGTIPEGQNAGQTCGSVGSQGSSGGSGPSGASGAAGPPVRVVTEHLTAGGTGHAHSADAAPSVDPEQAKVADAFWARRKGSHSVRVTNGTTQNICTLEASDGAADKSDAVQPASKSKAKEKAKPVAPPAKPSLLLTPLKPGESRDLGKVGGAGTIPVSVVACDGKLKGTFTMRLDRDTSVSLQPAGKAPKPGQGMAVFLTPGQ